MPNEVRVYVKVDLVHDFEFHGKPETAHLGTLGGSFIVPLDALGQMKLDPLTGAKLQLGKLFEDLRDQAAAKVAERV